MSLNREQKRALKSEVNSGRWNPCCHAQATCRKPQQEERVGFRRYLSEVRSELRKVAWPTDLKLSIIQL